MTGKYSDVSKNDLNSLPLFDGVSTNTSVNTSTTQHDSTPSNHTNTTTPENSLEYIINKITSVHNSAYTDSFFSYLTSKISQSQIYPWTTVLWFIYWVKSNYTFNIADDIGIYKKVMTSIE